MTFIVEWFVAGTACRFAMPARVNAYTVATAIEYARRQLAACGFVCLEPYTVRQLTPECDLPENRTPPE